MRTDRHEGTPSPVDRVDQAVLGEVLSDLAKLVRKYGLSNLVAALEALETTDFISRFTPVVRRVPNSLDVRPARTTRRVASGERNRRAVTASVRQLWADFSVTGTTPARVDDAVKRIRRRILELPADQQGPALKHAADVLPEKFGSDPGAWASAILDHPSESGLARGDG